MKLVRAYRKISRIMMTFSIVISIIIPMISVPLQSPVFANDTEAIESVFLDEEDILLSPAIVFAGSIFAVMEAAAVSSDDFRKFRRFIITPFLSCFKGFFVFPARSASRSMSRSESPVSLS